MLTLPVTFFSFPFYAYIDPIWTEGWHWLRFIRIRFLTIDLTPPLARAILGPHLITFAFFLPINLLGGLLGYWIGKKHSTEFFSSKWWKVLCADVGVGSVVLSFLLFILAPHSWNFIREDVSTALFVFGIFWFEIILLEIIVLPIVRYLLEPVDYSVEHQK